MPAWTPPTLVGPNWMVNIPAEWVSRVQAGIGGELIDETTEPTADPSETATAGVHTPTAADFKVSIKVLSKQCFGSAGCNIEYRPRISGVGTLPEEGTVEVSYKITGAEGPIQGTFTITLGEDPTVQGQDEESTSTSSSSAKLKIKITDVEVHRIGREAMVKWEQPEQPWQQFLFHPSDVGFVT
jgi:hypothetical protein